MKELLETRIERVYVSDSQEHIVFVHHVGPPPKVTAYETEADCCSETWFADIIGLHNLLGQTVIGVRVLEVEIPEGDTRTRQEYDEAYGYRLTTAKGDCDFIFRNSSNGCYGGSLILVKEERLPGVMDGQREFAQLTENEWQA